MITSQVPNLMTLILTHGLSGTLSRCTPVQHLCPYEHRHTDMHTGVILLPGPLTYEITIKSHVFKSFNFKTLCSISYDA